MRISRYTVKLMQRHIYLLYTRQSDVYLQEFSLNFKSIVSRLRVNARGLPNNISVKPTTGGSRSCGHLIHRPYRNIQ